MFERRGRYPPRTGAAIRQVDCTPIHTRKSATDAVYTVEVNGDLTQPWQSGARFTGQIVVGGHGATASITVRDRTAVSGSARRFLRHRVARVTTTPWADATSALLMAASG